MEPQFYVRVKEARTCGPLEFGVYPSDYYGQPNLSGDPVCSVWKWELVIISSCHYLKLCTREASLSIM